MSMVWPALGSRMAKEQDRTELGPQQQTRSNGMRQLDGTDRLTEGQTPDS